MKNIYLVILGLTIFTIVGIGLAFASCGACGQTDTAAKNSVSGSAAIDAGNKICPVLGEPINEETKATYEYQGKIYNFCCAGCVGAFKSQPQKYIDKVNLELQSAQTNGVPK